MSPKTKKLLLGLNALSSNTPLNRILGDDSCPEHPTQEELQEHDKKLFDH